MNKNLSAVILCGGRSSRMGQNKALLPFDIQNNENKTILDFQYEKLSKIFKKVYISSKHEYEKYETIKDISNVHSPLIGLFSIFDSLENDEFFIISVDTPLVKEKTILNIVDFYYKNNFDVVVPIDNTGKVHNLCGVFNRRILKDIKKNLDEDIHKINYLINNSKHHYLEFDYNEEFLNINKKEDYEKALKLIKNF